MITRSAPGGCALPGSTPTARSMYTAPGHFSAARRTECLLMSGPPCGLNHRKASPLHRDSRFRESLCFSFAIVSRRVSGSLLLPAATGSRPPQCQHRTGRSRHETAERHSPETVYCLFLSAEITDLSKLFNPSRTPGLREHCSGSAAEKLPFPIPSIRCSFPIYIPAASRPHCGIRLFRRESLCILLPVRFFHFRMGYFCIVV